MFLVERQINEYFSIFTTKSSLLFRATRLTGSGLLYNFQLFFIDATSDAPTGGFNSTREGGKLPPIHQSI